MILEPAGWAGGLSTRLRLVLYDRGPQACTHMFFKGRDRDKNKEREGGGGGER